MALLFWITFMFSSCAKTFSIVLEMKRKSVLFYSYSPNSTLLFTLCQFKTFLFPSHEIISKFFPLCGISLISSRPTNLRISIIFFFVVLFICFSGSQHYTTSSFFTLAKENIPIDDFVRALGIFTVSYSDHETRSGLLVLLVKFLFRLLRARAIVTKVHTFITIRVFFISFY